MKPFDAAKYERLMNGLEAVEMKLSEVMKGDNPTMRLDSEFFKKHYITYASLIKKRSYKSLNQIAEIKRGITPKEYGEYDIPVLRSGDLNGRWVDKTTLLRTKKSIDLFFLKRNDVLISSIGFGSIGKVDLFFSDEGFATVSEVTVLRNASVNAFTLSEYLKSKFGQAFIEKSITGATGQLHLNTGSVQDLPVPTFSDLFDKKIEQIISQSYEIIFQSQSIYKQAEVLLLDKLGLRNWQPTQANTEIKTFKNSFLQSGRLDAEYYQPKFDELIEKLHATNESIPLGGLLTYNQRGTQPVYTDSENGLPVLNSKHIRKNRIDFIDNRNGHKEFASSNTIIRYGDVLINGTGVGTIGRTAPYLLHKEALPDNHVTILRTHAIDPVFLSVMLNSIIGSMQVEKYFKGSSGQIELYPTDINEFIVWNAPKPIQQAVRNCIEEAAQLEQQSQRLLNVAKQAVEIAIEENEETAMQFIKTQTRN